MSATIQSPAFTGPPVFMVPEDLSAVTHVKVFGERNTGTNFLVEAFALNAPTLKSLTHEHRSIWPSLARRLPGAWGRRLYNAALDRQRRLETSENFGWKHAAIDPKVIKAVPLYGRTLLVCMVRNPYYFLNSLYRRPYNIEPPPVGNRAEFMSAGVVPNRRDRIGTEALASPVCLWNLKVASYLEYADKLGLFVVRYEDAVNHFDKMFEQLSGSGLSATAPWKVPLKSSKGDPMGFSDYVEKTNSFDPSSMFAQAELSDIRNYLDCDLCRRLGYPVY